MKAWILSVGDEVLSGKIVNTNFSDISSYFNQIGIDVIYKRIPRIEKKAQFKTDKDSVVEYSALMKLKTALENGKMAREVELTDEERLMIKNFGFLTMKPMIYVLNVNEDEVNEENEYVKQVKEFAASHNCKSVVISAKL